LEEGIDPVTVRIRILVDDDEQEQGAVEWVFPNVRRVGLDPIISIQPNIDLPDISEQLETLREMTAASVHSARVGLEFDARPGEEGNHDIYTWQLVPKPIGP
jgi:hypothetical protein